MTVLHAVRPRSTDSGTQGESLLQHFYFIAVIVIVFALAALRIVVLRRRNQTLSNFFRTGGNSQYSYGSYPPHDTNPGSLLHGIQLATPPAAYHPDRRLRATDLDSHGRRLGSGEEWEGKDTLPAYDNLDRPPKYLEASWSQGGPPPTGQSAVTSSYAGQQSGTAQPNVTNEVTGNNLHQSDDTHAMAGPAHGSEAPMPAPIHNDLSRS